MILTLHFMKNTSFSKFGELRADLLVLRMSDSYLNSLSNDAEDGSVEFETKGKKERGGRVGGI